MGISARLDALKAALADIGRTNAVIAAGPSHELDKARWLTARGRPVFLLNAQVAQVIRNHYASGMAAAAAAGDLRRFSPNAAIDLALSRAFVLRLPDGGDVPFRALTARYAERKRRAGKPTPDIGVYSGALRSAIASRAITFRLVPR